MTAPELYDLAPSPWSLRARWALHHHEIKHLKHDYQPFIGELAFRWKLWDWTGKVTTPALITSSGSVRDGLAIARWAESHSTLSAASPLFPEGSLSDILRFDQQCLKRLKRSFFPEKAVDLLGERILGLLGTVILTLFARKYRSISTATSKQEAENWLVECKGRLKPGTYVLGAFTFADIAAAITIEYLHTTNAIGKQALGDEWARLPADVSHLVDDNLVAYCSWIYEKHFPASCPRIKKLGK
ncbi:hypothetical protein WJX73_003292 [Symbiochloris irregularis]|uniref:GST N-terminal domain-containing protein n=1 Tax=Symbiochloris irregularis TaxID=706552 RepID=A0AAW1P6I8_9CHLO